MIYLFKDRMKTPEQCVKSVESYQRHQNHTHCSGVSIADFE